VNVFGVDAVVALVLAASALDRHSIAASPTDAARRANASQGKIRRLMSDLRRNFGQCSDSPAEEASGGLGGIPRMVRKWLKLIQNSQISRFAIFRFLTRRKAGLQTRVKRSFAIQAAAKTKNSQLNDL
jgi:hypothetical protein